MDDKIDEDLNTIIKKEEEEVDNYEDKGEEECNDDDDFINRNPDYCENRKGGLNVSKKNQK